MKNNTKMRFSVQRTILKSILSGPLYATSALSNSSCAKAPVDAKVLNQQQDHQEQQNIQQQENRQQQNLSNNQNNDQEPTDSFETLQNLKVYFNWDLLNNERSINNVKIVKKYKFLPNQNENNNLWHELLQDFKINATDKLGLMNCANRSLEGGGGIDACFMYWTQTFSNGDLWKNKKYSSLNYSDGKSIEDPNYQLSVGKYVYSIVPKGEYKDWVVFHGCGINAGSDVGKDRTCKNLEEVMKVHKEMIFGMLETAEKKKLTHFVMAAISSDIFAGAGGVNSEGEQFSRKDFLDAIYRGIFSGTKEFIEKNKNSKLKIIFNNFDNKKEIL